MISLASVKSVCCSYLPLYIKDMWSRSSEDIKYPHIYFMVTMNIFSGLQAQIINSGDPKEKVPMGINLKKLKNLNN